MKLKYFFIFTTAFLVLLSVACNNDNEYTVTGASSDAQIISFSIDATPYTAWDTITYPALSKTNFTVQNKGSHLIFNVDSLPMHTDLRSLNVKLEYSNTPSKLELLYPNDSILEWNGTDSIKFEFKQKEGVYYPQFRTLAPDQKTERTYRVEFRIHQQDPDSIKWIKQDNFLLPAKGEQHIIKNAAGNKFLAFMKEGDKVNYYTSPIEKPEWSNAQTTNLPSSVILKSISQTKEVFIAVDTEGNGYTSPIANGINWTKGTLTNVVALLGVLPEINEQSAKNEILVVYRDSENKLKYGKTNDFTAIEPLKVSTRGDSGELLDEFPIKDFTSLAHYIADEGAIVITGGLDQNNILRKKSWRISNVALSDASNKAEIRVVGGRTTSLFPEKDQVQTFLYDDQIYAMSTDSLSLYRSVNSDNWVVVDEKQQLNEKMVDLGKPSIVVDEVNNIWVFSGVSKEGVYSREIWRGRLNKLAAKQ